MRTAAMDDYFFNEIKSHPVFQAPARRCARLARPVVVRSGRHSFCR